MPKQKNYTEEELITLLKERNQPAFSYLYDNYSRSIFSLIFLMLKDKEEAEDVMQKVFLKIWNNIDAYDASKGRLYTWMINIARNSSIDEARSKNTKNKSKIQEIKETVYVRNGMYIDDKKHEAIGLSYAINKLSDEENNIIQLAYFEGYTQVEIANILKMPLGSVKTKIRQTLIKLRELTTDKVKS